MDQPPSELCRDSQLQILLRSDERSAEFQRTAAHIESCRACQNRLAELAAERSSWQEAIAFLAECGSDTAFQDLTTSTESTDSVIDILRRLEFLTAPSHFRALGRIGRYEVERVVGCGGMGIVLLAHDKELGRQVAIKALLPHLANNGPARQRFAREARAAAVIEHENVVAIFDVVSHDRIPYLVMQHIGGESLQHRVERQGPLTPGEVLRIGIQTAAGLGAAHACGVVHRDIKPSNILLDKRIERAMVTDFGLARAADDARVTRTGVVAGTPHFMSPEQAAGHGVGFQSDLFSLGATLYFALTGHPPFCAEAPLAVLNRICRDRHRPVWKVNPATPLELSDAIDRLLKKQPDQRPSGANEVVNVLTHAAAGVQRPQWPVIRRLRRAGRRPFLVITALFTVCLTVAVAALILIVRKETAPPAQEQTRPPPPSEDALDAGVSPPAEFWKSLETTRNDLDELEQSIGNDSLPEIVGP